MSMAAAKPFKENPFYASDLEMGAKEGAVYQADEHVIPVRSWARGSPFARGGKVTSSVGDRSASTPGGDGEYGNLEKYWPGEDVPPREDDGDDNDGNYDEADGEEVQEEDYLDDSGRPELASLADNPNNSFVEAFNQVYAQYKQDAAAAGGAVSPSPRQEGGEGENDAPSYEESQRAYAKLSKRLSESNLKGGGVAAKQQQEEEEEEERGGEDIGDLAAYLGLTDTQGENVFFNNQPGFRAGGEEEDEDEEEEAEEEEEEDEGGYLNDARFEDEDEDQDFQPLRRGGKTNNSNSSSSSSPRRAQLKKLTKEEVREIQSEYQNLYAALQSPRAAPGPGPGPGAAGKSKGKGLSKSQKAAAREHLQMLKTKGRAGVASLIKDSVLAPKREREREREKRAPRHQAGADSDDDDQHGQQQQQQGQGERTDAELKHRQYLQSVAAKRKQEDELLLRLALKVCLLLFSSLLFSSLLFSSLLFSSLLFSSLLLSSLLLSSLLPC